MSAKEQTISIMKGYGPLEEKASKLRSLWINETTLSLSLCKIWFFYDLNEEDIMTSVCLNAKRIAWLMRLEQR
jgi:hypothetical protein